MSVVAVGGDIRIPVFGRLNDIGVESYEVEEGMRKKEEWESTKVESVRSEIFKGRR